MSPRDRVEGARKAAAGSDGLGGEGGPLSMGWAAGLLALSMAFVVAALLTQRDEPPEPEEPPASARIAVLPSTPTGEPPTPFARGLALELVRVLDRHGPAGLVVADRSQTARAAVGPEDGVAVTASADAERVLALHVERAGDRVRVEAVLHDAADPRAHWTRRYEPTTGELPQALLELAREVALAFGIRSDAAGGGRAVAPDAYAAYLEGLAELARDDEPGRRAATAAFEHARAADPAFEPACAALATSLVLAADEGLAPDEGEAPLERAHALAAELVTDDGGSAEALAVRGYARLVREWSWQAAEEDLRRAVERAPGAPRARQWLARLLSAAGRHREAVAQAAAALRDDRRSALGWLELGARRADAGEDARAVEAFGHALECDGSAWRALVGRGLARLRLDRGEAALADLERAVERSRRAPRALGGLAYACARLEQRDRARELLAELLELAADEPLRPDGVAAVYAALDDGDTAIGWLELALARRSPSALRLPCAPELDALRAHPEYPKLRERIGLADSRP